MFKENTFYRVTANFFVYDYYTETGYDIKKDELVLVTKATFIKYYNMNNEKKFSIALIVGYKQLEDTSWSESRANLLEEIT